MHTMGHCLPLNASDPYCCAGRRSGNKVSVCLLCGPRSLREPRQIQLLEGCACHPHPLCREVWCDALRGTPWDGRRPCALAWCGVLTGSRNLREVLVGDKHQHRRRWCDFFSPIYVPPADELDSFRRLRWFAVDNTSRLPLLASPEDELRSTAPRVLIECTGFVTAKHEDSSICIQN